MNDPLMAYTLHLSNHSFPLFMKRQICFLIPDIVLLTLGNCFLRRDAYGYIFRWFVFIGLISFILALSYFILG